MCKLLKYFLQNIYGVGRLNPLYPFIIIIYNYIFLSKTMKKKKENEKLIAVNSSIFKHVSYNEIRFGRAVNSPNVRQAL